LICKIGAIGRELVDRNAQPIFLLDQSQDLTCEFLDLQFEVGGSKPHEGLMALDALAFTDEQFLDEAIGSRVDELLCGRFEVGLGLDVEGVGDHGQTYKARKESKESKAFGEAARWDLRGGFTDGLGSCLGG
jgi:hypothetical protein